MRRDFSPSEFEHDILRHLSGRNVPGLRWGAAMSVAVEALQGAGYVTRGHTVRLTDKGRYFLEQHGEG